MATLTLCAMSGHKLTHLTEASPVLQPPQKEPRAGDRPRRRTSLHRSLPVRIDAAPRHKTVLGRERSLGTYRSSALPLPRRSRSNVRRRAILLRHKRRRALNPIAHPRRVYLPPRCCRPIELPNRHQALLVNAQPSAAPGEGSTSAPASSIVPRRKLHFRMGMRFRESIRIV
jgi:hypothetical protein